MVFDSSLKCLLAVSENFGDIIVDYEMPGLQERCPCELNKKTQGLTFHLDLLVIVIPLR